MCTEGSNWGFSSREFHRLDALKTFRRISRRHSGFTSINVLCSSRRSIGGTVSRMNPALLGNIYRFESARWKRNDSISWIFSSSSGVMISSQQILYHTYKILGLFLMLWEAHIHTLHGFSWILLSKLVLQNSTVSSILISLSLTDGWGLLYITCAWICLSSYC